MTEQEALLVLNAIPNLGAVRIRKLMAFFGSASEILQASLEDLRISNLLMPETVENILHFSKDKFLQDEYNLMQHNGIVAITAADENFPGPLRNNEDLPVVLYIKGRIDCLEGMSLAIVGSRAASFYGCRTANAFAQSFVQAGMTVVSGLARGIDTAAHQGALEAGGKTIAVIGCGFNYVYPKENIFLMEKIVQSGAVISEFSCSMPPLKQNFPWRNRIISALSEATVVIEAGKRSGALITADYAQAQNKEVFVVPSNIDTETALGSNQLIQDGACIVLNPDDVLSQVKKGHLPLPQDERGPLLLLSDEQEKVYPHVTFQPVHVDELAQRSGLDVSRLMNIVLSLELKHAIRQLPGQYYVRNANA